jgi:hypothetical protein
VWEDERIVSLTWRYYTGNTANNKHCRIKVKPTEDVKIRADLKYFWAHCGNIGALFTNVPELTVKMGHKHKTVPATKPEIQPAFSDPMHLH